jgi:hypothetical protein
VLRRIFGQKMDEVTESWRKLHNEELCNLYSLQNLIRINKSRRMRWEGNVTRMERRGMHIGYRWEGQKETNRPLGRTRPRWVDNIKSTLREIEWGGMDWIDLDQDGDQWRALVNTVMNFRVP